VREAGRDDRVSCGFPAYECSSIHEGGFVWLALQVVNRGTFVPGLWRCGVFQKGEKQMKKLVGLILLVGVCAQPVKAEEKKTQEGTKTNAERKREFRSEEELRLAYRLANFWREFYVVCTGADTDTVESEVREELHGRVITNFIPYVAPEKRDEQWKQMELKLIYEIAVGYRDQVTCANVIRGDGSWYMKKLVAKRLAEAMKKWCKQNRRR